MNAYHKPNRQIGNLKSGTQSIGFTGSLNGMDAVTINGAAATVNGSKCFSRLASLTPGTTGTVSVVATDSRGNSRTNHYQTAAPAQPSYSGTYDADGNELMTLTTGTGQSYTWDVKNELVQIAQASGTSQFAYDALGHRISESVNGTLTKQWVWDGDTLAEERNASNTVTKRFYPQGEQISGTTYYYTRDHLGSVREVTGTSGAIQARYDYDPYGRSTQLQGTLISDFQYAGYYTHAASGLYFPVHRPYDPITDRWLSRDPLGEAGGIDLYGYVLNDPINGTDPLGLVNWGQLAGGTAALAFGTVTALGAAATGPFAPLAAISAAISISYGVGNIVAAFASPSPQTEMMQNSPSNLGGALGRVFGGQLGQDIGAMGEDSLANPESLRDGAQKLTNLASDFNGLLNDSPSGTNPSGGGSSLNSGAYDGSGTGYNGEGHAPIWDTHNHYGLDGCSRSAADDPANDPFNNGFFNNSFR